MSEHVLDQLADYLEGRLDAARARAVEEHLAECSECAGDFAWAREFRNAAAGSAPEHLAPERVVELADGVGAPLDDRERRHLASCGACARELAWTRELPRRGDDPDADREKGMPPPRIVRDAGASTRSRPRPLRRWAVTALAAAAALLVFVALPRHRTSRLSELARVEPLPVHIQRGDVEPGSFEESRMRGLEMYADGNFAAARDPLRRAFDLRPDDAEIALYLGSTELLLKDTAKAVPLLRQAASPEAMPAIREEALWQLANAALVAGRADDARRTLDEVITLDRRHRADAEALRHRLK